MLFIFIMSDYKYKYLKYKKKYVDLSNKLGGVNKIKNKGKSLSKMLEEIEKQYIPKEKYRIVDNRIEFYDKYINKPSKYKIFFNFYSLQQLNEGCELVREGEKYYLQTKITPYIYIRDIQTKKYSDLRFKDTEQKHGTIRIIQTPYFYEKILKPAMLKIRKETKWYNNFFNKYNTSEEHNYFIKKNLLLKTKFLNGYLITIPKIDDYTYEYEKLKYRKGFKKASFHSIYIPNNYLDNYVSFIDLTKDNLSDLINYKKDVIKWLINNFSFEEKDILIYCYTNDLHNPILDFYIDCVNEENLIYKPLYKYENLWLIDNIIDHLNLNNKGHAPPLKDLVFEYMSLPQGLPPFDMNQYIEEVKKITEDNVFNTDIWDKIYETIFSNTIEKNKGYNWKNMKGGVLNYIFDFGKGTTAVGYNDQMLEEDVDKKEEKIKKVAIQFDDIISTNKDEYHVKNKDVWYKITVNFDDIINKGFQYDIFMNEDTYRYGKLKDNFIRFNLEKAEEGKNDWWGKEYHLYSRYIDTPNNYIKVIDKLSDIESKVYKDIKNNVGNNKLQSMEEFKKWYGLIQDEEQKNEIVKSYYFDKYDNSMNHIYHLLLNPFGMPDNIKKILNNIRGKKDFQYLKNNINVPSLYYIFWLINKTIIGVRGIKSSLINDLKKYLGECIMYIKNKYNLNSILYIRNYLQYPNRKDVSNLHFHFNFRPYKEEWIGYEDNAYISKNKLRNISPYQIFNILDKYPNYFEKRTFYFIGETNKIKQYYTSEYQYK